MYTADGGIFTGNLWLDRFVSGVRTGERDVGNCPKFTLVKPTIEQKEKLSHRVESFGQSAQIQVMKNQRKVQISLDDLAGAFKDNLVLAMFGEDSVVSVTAGSVTAESITAHLGKGTKLAKKKVKSTPAVVVEAETPDAWADEEPYVLTDFVLAGIYRAECTTAGTSGTTEPTWAGKVPGDTVTDGTVTWTIRKLTYDLDIDYELTTTADITHIIPLSTGAIVEGQTLEVDYSYDSYSGYKILADKNTQVDIFCRLVGTNIANGDSVEVVVYKATFKPTSDLAWIMDDFGVLELEGDVLATDDGTWDVEVLEAA
jgi:hypothetical protein